MTAVPSINAVVGAMPLAAMKAGMSWLCGSSVATVSRKRTRQTANRPRRVMYALMPRKANTTSDLRLPPPIRIRVLLPQPEASVMPTPKLSPPTRCDNQISLLLV